MIPVIEMLMFLSLAATSSNSFIPEMEGMLIEDSMGRQPIYFIENMGQMDDDVHFIVKGSDKTLYFTSDGIIFKLLDDDAGRQKTSIVKLDFMGVNKGIKPMGEDKKKTVFSYFNGKPAHWKTAVPTFGKLVYPNLWPEIDLVYSGTTNRLKYEFIVKPGGDPKRIRLAYRGVDRIHVNSDGKLEVTAPLRCFSDGKPYAYQILDEVEEEVFMQYKLHEDSRQDCHAYGFEVGAYDRSKPLILDPELLVYCGYIGGIDQDMENANRTYYLLGSATGTTPGTSLPGGQATLPLIWDPITDLILSLLNTTTFQNFKGVLNNNGYATATLNFPQVPGAAGATLYFAYALKGPWNFASSSLAIEIIP